MDRNLVQKNLVVKMLRQRGNEHPVKNFAFKILVGNVVAYFEKCSKITRDFVKKIISDLNNDIELIIIVHEKSITTDAANALKNSSIKFQTWTFDEMSFNLMEVVPPHSLVEGEKPKEWKKFPIISSLDPVARYFGFQKDDIVRIQEDESITFRRVV